MNLPSSVQVTYPVPDYPVYEIDHAAVKAKVALHGAHLMEWQPAGQEPVLYLSREALIQAGKPIRGGVPICWPWFGPNSENASLPMHGLVRTRFWNLAEATEDAAGVKLVFTVTSDEDTLKLWPHEFHLTLELILGAELSMVLVMDNTGTTECKITGALHTYLSVDDITKVAVKGLDGTQYFDKLDGQVHRQEGDILIDREVDRQYGTSEAVVVQDDSSGRSLTVIPEGSECAVVWNPWILKTISLADMPDEDYKSFVCVETANAWTDVVTVAPGGSHRLAAVVSCG